MNTQDFKVKIEQDKLHTVVTKLFDLFDDEKVTLEEGALVMISAFATISLHLNIDLKESMKSLFDASGAILEEYNRRKTIQ